MAKIKIYKAFTAYNSYLKFFYERNKELEFMDFETQRRRLIEDYFPWIFSWTTSNCFDDIEIFETVNNAECLQKSWSNKYNDSPNWQVELVLNQIREQKPQVCVLYPPEIFNAEIIERIRNESSHEMYIIGYDGMNRLNKLRYIGYDLIITCSDFISGFYSQNGFTTYTLPFGFNSNILEHINVQDSKPYDVGFSGSIFANMHDKRFELLKVLTRKLNVDIRSDFELGKNNSFISKRQIKRLLKEKNVSNFLAYQRISRLNKGPVFGLDMYQFLSDSRIAINLHGDKIDFAANVRLYEATGVGSCLLTDWKRNISEIFDIDKEIVTFSTPEEALSKAKFLLKNETVRKRIALAGQKRTLSNYSYSKIIPEILKFIKQQV